MYNKCYLCGREHDDGGVLERNGKRYFLCLDCLDDMTQADIDQAIREREGKDERISDTSREL